MKSQFIRQNRTPRLVLFFNGWSMDANVAHALAGADDLLAVWDYTDFDLDLRPLIDSYQGVRLVAWSLGVWYAAKYFEKLDVAFEEAVAVNGTLLPVSAQYGIAPDIITGTADNWLIQRTRDRFNLRVTGGGEALDAFPFPLRDAVSQQNELNSLLAHIANSPVPANLYKCAVIGNRDRIFPPSAQRAAWKLTATRVIELDAPHYPFALYPEVAEYWKS